jgi:hypothetical protein
VHIVLQPKAQSRADAFAAAASAYRITRMGRRILKEMRNTMHALKELLTMKW